MTEQIEMSHPEVDVQRRDGHADTALAPLLHPYIARLIETEPQTLTALINRYGSPLHIVWPQIVQHNVDNFRTVLARHDVRYGMFYGAKANKSPALVRAAVEAGIGVDVSSVYEMRDALRAGIDPSRLCATGPAKTRVFHAALVSCGALISLDSIEEFDDLQALVREIEPDRAVRVLLRYRPDGATASRFGMSMEAVLDCLLRLVEQRKDFSLEGFHFHLSGYDAAPRAQAVIESMQLIDAARHFGLDPKILDIGGGLPVRYVDTDHYDTFLREQRAGDYRHGKVPASFYPYGGKTGAAEWLDRLLAMPCAPDLSIAGYLNEQNLTLAIEPGRSLVDQAAISVFRITRVKRLCAGNAVIFVEGSSFSACETWFASEFLVDPILVPAPERRTDGAAATPIRAYIAGHSCLDDDVVTNRLIAFPVEPHAGDLLVYANTAGYQMDLLENEFHRHPMPRRICIRVDAEQRMETSLDDPMEDWK